jgi:hypothetical protein
VDMLVALPLELKLRVLPLGPGLELPPGGWPAAAAVFVPPVDPAPPRFVPAAAVVPPRLVAFVAPAPPVAPFDALVVFALAPPVPAVVFV